MSMDIQGVPPGSVVITPEGMYQELKAVHATLDVLVSKFDDVPDRLRDHEQRIRLVEQWRWKTQGLAVAGSVLFGGLSGVLSQYVAK